MAELDAAEPRERVRERYAVAASEAGECGCGGVCRDDALTTDRAGREVFGAALHTGAEPDTAGSGILSLGCGVPTTVADLHPGEVVVDLGSGAGADVLISARGVGPERSRFATAAHARPVAPRVDALWRSTLPDGEGGRP